MSLMMMNLFGDLPKIISSEFSVVLMEGTILMKSEKNEIKEFLVKFFDRSEAFEMLLEELRGMTLMVRYASMKYLVALFDSDSGHCFTVGTKEHIVLALKLIAEVAVRPSEVHDGLDLIKKTPSILRRSGDFGEILEELVLPLTILIKKLEVFEICEARLTLRKTKAVKSLAEMVLSLSGGGEIWEKIREVMKSICEGENGLQGVLEEASGTDLVALLSKTEEEYGSQVGQTRRRHRMNKMIFEFKWTHVPSSRYKSRTNVNVEGDAICYVELLAHYLNLRTIHGEMNLAGLKVLLFGEDETEQNWVMLKIDLQSQDAHLVVKGEVEIHSNSEGLCDLAREKVLMLANKPEVIKF